MRRLVIWLGVIVGWGVCAPGVQAQEPSRPIRFRTGIGELAAITVYVRDQQRALDWYSERLGFEVRVDEWRGADQRILAISLPGQDRPLIFLERVSDRHNPQYLGRIGGQGGWVFSAPDLIETYMRLRDLDVRFTETPVETSQGLRAAFVDLLGNEWILVQPPEPGGELPEADGPWPQTGGPSPDTDGGPPGSDG